MATPVSEAWSRWTALWLIVCCGLTSCRGDNGNQGLPAWDPATVADAAIAQLDDDDSGNLNEAELEASPGLIQALQMGDRNRDGLLDRDELVARFAEYRSTTPQPANFQFEVYRQSQPLSGANVRLVPADFFGDALPVAAGVADDQGRVQPTSEGAEQGVWLGVYRVEVESPDGGLPAEYNTDSRLGLEVVTSGRLTRSGQAPRLDLK